MGSSFGSAAYGIFFLMIKNLKGTKKSGKLGLSGAGGFGYNA